jgi:hypothetical protein
MRARVGRAPEVELARRSVAASTGSNVGNTRTVCEASPVRCRRFSWLAGKGIEDKLGQRVERSAQRGLDWYCEPRVVGIERRDP